ncbi:MAG: putative ABC transporter permease [Anaerostipes hadrus]
MTYYDILFSFFIYGFLGWCAEVAFAAFKQHSFVNRGFLNGPICPIYGIGVTVVVASLQPYVGNLILLYITSTILATFLEWLTGFLLEKMFHHRWWDYSDMPLNIGGYVCPLFSEIWGVACVLIVKLIYPFTDKLVSFLPVWLGKFLLVLLTITILFDICITVLGILKFNKRLALMEDIAKELRNISDQIGENIYDSMMDGLEAQDRLKARADVIREKVDEVKQENAEEVKARMDSLKLRADELRARYEKMAKLPTFTSRRILRAFPR